MNIICYIFIYNFRKDRNRYRIFKMSDNNNDVMYDEYMGMFSSFLSFYQSFYLAKAKKFGKDGLLNEAMKFLKTAQSYKNTDKVSRRIEALQAVIDAENESNSSAGEEDDEQGVQVGFLRVIT